MEGVRIFSSQDLVSSESYSEVSVEFARLFVEKDMKSLLSGLARSLFGESVEIRWRTDYFPFTEPSFELDVFYNGDWMEVLGCGIIHDEVMKNAGLNPHLSQPEPSTSGLLNNTSDFEVFRPLFLP